MLLLILKFQDELLLLFSVRGRVFLSIGEVHCAELVRFKNLLLENPNIFLRSGDWSKSVGGKMLSTS